MNLSFGKLRDLLVSMLIAELAGVINSVFTASSIPTWYAGLERPWWTPPSWIFNPAWFVLYILVGISAYFVWEVRHQRKEAESALVFYGVQLLFSSFWGIIFFGLQEIGLALAEIFVLWLLIIYTMILFFRVSKPAGWVLVPYLIWVSYTMVLNASIFSLEVCNNASALKCVFLFLGS